MQHSAGLCSLLVQVLQEDPGCIQRGLSDSGLLDQPVTVIEPCVYSVLLTGATCPASSHPYRFWRDGAHLRVVADASRYGVLLQDLWTGQRTSADADTFGFYFSGHLVLESVLSELDAQGLTSATQIVLTGESAGGIGVWPNLDWIAERYPKARVIGVPIAGYYFWAYPYQGRSVII